MGGSIRGIYRTESYSSTRITGTDVTLQNSPYLVMNLNLYYYPFLTHSIKVFATIENITNQRYYNVYFGNEEGLIRTPQDPIRFLGGISYEF